MLHETTSPICVMHVIYRLAAGGLENGLVNIINRTQGPEMRHVVVVLSSASDFRQRLPNEVPVHLLEKRAGNDFSLYGKIYSLIKRFRPDVFHTRNLACIEYQSIACYLRVPRRIHSDHGWDIEDPNGEALKPALIRRLFALFTTHYVVLSQQAEAYALERVRVPQRKLYRICNGVDTAHFSVDESPLSGTGQGVRVGIIARLEPIKGVLAVVDVARLTQELRTEGDTPVCFSIVGEGALRDALEARIKALSLQGVVSLEGASSCPLDWYRQFDLFLLTSKAEGISNTILEAMACHLPVIATRVGGNAELVEEGRNGYLFEVDDLEGMALCIKGYAEDVDKRIAHGHHGRQRAVQQFSIDGMVSRYSKLYRDGGSV
ncbi:glycosyltransferase [Aestuariirhabdus litorea]|nr:glycosyltransferase [Aestuariirhabdus litorea]